MTESEKFLVVQDYDMFGESIYYCGDSEIEAFRKYKTIKGGKMNIFKAKVKMQTILDNPFIMSFEILETIA